MSVRTGTFPARSLLPGDITSEGRVADCVGAGWRPGVSSGCCKVYYRTGNGPQDWRVVTYTLNEPVEVIGHES